MTSLNAGKDCPGRNYHRNEGQNGDKMSNMTDFLMLPLADSWRRREHSQQRLEVMMKSNRADFLDPIQNKAVLFNHAEGTAADSPLSLLP